MHPKDTNTLHMHLDALENNIITVSVETYVGMDL